MEILRKISRKIISLVLLIVVVVSTTTVVFAGSGSYKSTYEMSGGIYSKTMDVGKKPSFTVKLTPTKGYSGTIIRVFLEKKRKLGWSIAGQKDVSSQKASTTTYKRSASGIYRFYLRNYTGKTMRGNVAFSWKW